MVRKNLKIVASLVALATLGAPAAGSAQGYGYLNDDQPSVVVECGSGQRAVMEQRRVNGRTQVVARCEPAQARAVVYDEYGRAIQTRPVAYETSRPVARRASSVQYVERAPQQRSKTKSALMIAGSAAAGAGVGGALKGTKGALIGAAIGGGSASIYEAAKRR
jgi:hypothetical protein